MSAPFTSVEPRIEVVDRDHRLAHFADRSLAMRVGFADGEPRVEAEALGAFFGLARPRDARRTVAGMIQDGKLSDVEVCALGAQTSGGRPGREYLLTRLEAMLLATQLNTPRAWLVVKAMARALEMVLDMERGTFRDVRRVAVLEADRAHIAAQCDALRAQVRLLGAPTLGPLAKALIDVPLLAEAHRRASVAGGSWRRHHGLLTVELRYHLEYDIRKASGRRWPHFPNDIQSRAKLEQALEVVLGPAERRAQSVRTPRTRGRARNDGQTAFGFVTANGASL